ncbi:MAG TPA: hypothetical protein VIY52_12985 [Streptosporangiaceae bacterium]
MTAAMSDAQGTTLPRYGFFLGVHAPRYRMAVIAGELPSASPRGETNIRSWLEPHEYQTTQTNPASWAGHLLTYSWPQTCTPIVRNTDVAYAFVSDREDLTDSPWQKLRRALAPLQAASDAVLENISDTLDYERGSPARAKHAGLTAVARLVDLLGLSRPTILRMGGVPSSTFYAWQKNPNSVIRTPTITRLLQLQAQVAILDEVLDRERTRDWVLSAERFEKLQSDDAAFAQVLEEAKVALADATRIAPRPRMPRADYASGPREAAEVTARDSLPWPGASRLDEEET